MEGGGGGGGARKADLMVYVESKTLISYYPLINSKTLIALIKAISCSK